MTVALAWESAPVPPAVLPSCQIAVSGSKMREIRLVHFRAVKMLLEEVDDERQHQMANRYRHCTGCADRIFPGSKVS